MALHDITPITQEERATGTELVGDPTSHSFGHEGNKIQALSNQNSARQTEPRSLAWNSVWDKKRKGSHASRPDFIIPNQRMAPNIP